ncbi:hypothetical protein LNP17_02650 [Klebsiella variicola subsp. variicola]|nr:hypothetical protein [Klebsiella variicola subsp. variicola]
MDRDTAAWLVAPLIHYPHVGAVTGNPRIRTRSTLIGRIQVGEFSSIIGLDQADAADLWPGLLPSPV